MIGIIGAMELEMKKIRSLMEESKCVTVGCTDFYEGKLHGVDVVAAVCGVGKVNAALCTQAMLLRFAPTLVLNVGVGGGLLPTMHIGDIAIAAAVVQHDFDISPLGDPRGKVPNLQSINMTCDEQTIKSLLNAAKELDDVSIHTGVIATGDQFISKQAVKDDLTEHFSAIACEMEGGAIGQVCALHKVPFAVIRAISDGADDGSSVDFMTFAQQAAERSATLLLNFISQTKEGIA